MRNSGLLTYLAGVLLAICLSGCIHDYPNGIGVDPSKVSANIELIYDLRWQEMLHEIDNSSTRARTDRCHRFILEVMRNGNIICRDTSFITDDEMAMGRIRHKLSQPLGALQYDIAVWYDMTDPMHNSNRYAADNFKSLKSLSTAAVLEDSIQCAFASEMLDLTQYRGKLGVTATKEIELKHPGAKFRIVSTDIQEFISEQRPSLLQGDSFTIKLNFEEGTPIALNLYSGEPEYSYDSFDKASPLSLPFGDYEELEIAGGFLFCDYEDWITMSVSVYNSALMMVTKTRSFSVPLKRGYITRLVGDFLTHPINSPVTVDNIWEGEILVEI